MIQEQSWKNEEGLNADPRLFLDKRNKTSWLSRKNPGKNKKDLTLIQDYSWINDIRLLGCPGRVLENRRRAQRYPVEAGFHRFSRQSPRKTPTPGCRS